MNSNKSIQIKTNPNNHGVNGILKQLLLQKKLTIPTSEQQLWYDSNLISKIATFSNYSVITLIGRKGWGKAGMVLQALGGVPYETAWYKAGPEDGDLKVFVAYLTEALQKIVPGLKPWFKKQLKWESLDWKQAVHILVAGLEAKMKGTAGSVMIVENFSEIQQVEEIRHFFNRFLLYKPENLHLFLLDEGSLMLSELENLKFSGDLLEISEKDFGSVVIAPKKEEGLLIKSFGPLKIWRQGQEVDLQEWRRSMSRKLFQIMVSGRKQWLHRDRLMNELWPEVSENTAQRNFKVVLNQLMNVLEPERQPRAPGQYVLRKGNYYRLELHLNDWIDVEHFEKYVREGQSWLNYDNRQAKVLLERAWYLYQGEYFAGERLDDFSEQERQRLNNLALTAAEKLSEISLKQKRYEEALHWSERILQIDPCWEKAYCYKMICYSQLRNLVMMVRTYKRCFEVLQDEIGVEPSEQTIEVYRELLAHREVNQ